MIDCLFCKIANREMPAELVYENEEIIGFKSINPEAPVHLLFVPKRHVEWKDKFNEKDLSLLSGLISAAKEIAIKQEIDCACKLIFNVGETGHIPHIHLHLLGGWGKEIPMRNI